MKKVTLLCGLLLALVATTASAAGVNLRWNACPGDGGVANRNSTCASNTGSNVLVGSFLSDTDILGVTGIEVVVDLASAGASLPAWWQFNAAGSCRQTSLSVNPTISATAAACADWANGAAAGGLAAYKLGLYGPTSARIIIGFATGAQPPPDVLGGQEYFGFNANINNAKTVGTGACAGCTVPVCLVLNSINVVPGILAGHKLIGPTNGTDSNFATWQGGVIGGSPLGTGCPAATPTRNTTWGSVKSLYR
jgi:hypothetical protein